MPQLMPMNWCLVIFVYLLISLMMVLLYYEDNNFSMNYINKSEKDTMSLDNWKW